MAKPLVSINYDGSSEVTRCSACGKILAPNEGELCNGRLYCRGCAPSLTGKRKNSKNKSGKTATELADEAKKIKEDTIKASIAKSLRKISSKADYPVERYYGQLDSIRAELGADEETIAYILEFIVEYVVEDGPYLGPQENLAPIKFRSLILTHEHEALERKKLRDQLNSLTPQERDTYFAQPTITVTSRRDELSNRKSILDERIGKMTKKTIPEGALDDDLAWEMDNSNPFSIMAERAKKEEKSRKKKKKPDDEIIDDSFFEI